MALSSNPGLFGRFIAAWTGAAQRNALAVLIVAALFGAACAWYTAGHLSVDTSTSNMLSADLPWRKAERELDRLFPEQDTGLVIVLDGSSGEAADAAQRRLVDRLRAQPQLFTEVFAAETDPYFRKNGLLYLDKNALQELSDGLLRAQPFLGALNQDLSLRGLFTLLGHAIDTPPGSADGFDLATPLARLAETIDAVAAGKDHPLSWNSLLGDRPAQSGTERRFIQVAPKRDFSRMLPAAAAIDAIRAEARALQIDDAHGVRLRLTGDIAMEHEELGTAFSGAGLSLGLGMLMVAVLLYLALRSGRLVVSAVITLVYGLLLTASFAALAIGHLNLISIAFGVLYVGLGIDYALYLSMQFRERLGQGLPPEQALPRAASEVGPFMAVCATTVSIGFFAFVPTPFTGIAELGLISGVGMFISLVVTLTLLPALIRVMPPAAEQVKLRPPDEGALARVLDWPYRRARAIWIGAAVVAMLALTLVPRARFDSDPIKLRDPNSEAVKTFRELLRDPNVPTLTLSVLAPDEAQARAIADRLGQLPEVRRALTLWDLVPQDQDAKLAMLGELALNLALQPVPNIPDPASTRADDLRTMRALAQSLPAYVERSRDAQREAGARLLAALRRLDAQLDQQDPATQLQTLTRLREALLGSLPAQLEDLTTALNAGKVTEADLPAPLQHRWRGIDGRYRVEIWPREVLDNQAATARFVDAVHRVAPDAAGPPVDTLESGRAVVSAFKQAFLYSFVAISLLLLVLLRSFKDTLLVLVPLVLAGLLTVATLVLLGIPFNFANVIALPLVLGVGVDYGVYLVQRGRAAGAPANILHTSTARAVLFGALITMANFGNLMLARHPGMVGMGLLLTVGLGMTLLCALVLLPSLLAPRTQARRDRAAAGVDDQ